jgi:hypothetical protein
MSKLMGIREYARHRGIHHHAVQRAIKSGRIKTVKGPDGREMIDAPVADRAWRANTDPGKAPPPRRGAKPPARAPVAPDPDEDDDDDDEADEPRGYSGGSGGDEDSGYYKARARKEHWAAELKEIEFQKKAGTLVEVAQVQKEFDKLARQIKEGILNIPVRISHELASETDPHKVNLILEKEIRAVLEELTSEFAG